MSYEFIALLIGSIFTVIAVYRFIARRNVTKNGECTSAMVVKTVKSYVDMGSDGGGGTVYCPILKYDVDGQTHEVKYKGGHGSPMYKDGEVVEIIYSKKHNEKIIIANDKMPVILSFVFICIGLVALGIGIFLIIF